MRGCGSCAARGLTLKQVGEHAGLSHAFLSQFERGLTTASVNTLQRIAVALGTTVSALLATRTEQEIGVLRAGEGVAVPRADVPDGTTVRSLSRADWPVQPTWRPTRAARRTGGGCSAISRSGCW